MTWIKVRTNLDTDPRVLAMAAELNVPELHVVGMLWKVWSWADSHSINGNAMCVTDVTLERFTGVTGFAHALRKVGWLTGGNGLATFPNFDEHNGDTAKKRAQTAKRVTKHRNADVTQEALPDKRREEKKVIPKGITETTKKFIPPTEQEVADYCRERKNGLDPETFIAHYSARGWKFKGGQSMKDWKAAVVTFEKNAIKFGDAQQKPKLPRICETEEQFREFQRLNGG